MRNYAFRKLTPADVPLMRQWLDTAHVKTWWPNAEKQAALMLQDMENPNLNMQVVCLSNRPFAYFHDHDVRTFGMMHYGDLAPGTRVIDTFVGDTDFLSQGHSAGYIDARVRVLRIKYPMIAAAPNTTDTRAVGIYTQAGFRKRRLAPSRDGRLLQVMTHF